ncbi:MAG: hypothetical protein VKO64_07190 [Candidatus Sericytochromatia bacterium]|nr:hypothetical protein [Candidatus Sericytochromatia bacterium]
MQTIVRTPAQTLEAMQFRLRQQVRVDDAIGAVEIRYAIEIVARLARLIASGLMTSVSTRRLLETATACEEGRLSWRMLQALLAREARAIRQSALPTRKQLAEEMAAASTGMAVAAGIEEMVGRAREIRDADSGIIRGRERHVAELLERCNRLMQALNQLTGAPIDPEEARMLERGVREVINLEDNRLYAGTRFAATMANLFRTRRLSA